MSEQERDPYEDLAGVDLDALDIDGSLTGSEAGAAWTRWLAVIGLSALGAGILYFPTTDAYRRLGDHPVVFFGLCIGGVLVGLTLGRLLWRFAQEAGARYDDRPAEEDENKPASALRRYTLLALLIGGGVAIVTLVPDSSYYAYGESTWFIGAFAAIVLGIVGGRWLLMQAQARALLDTSTYEPIRFPPWFKWVTLSALVALALFAGFGMQLFGGGENADVFEFVLGAIGFVVGVFGAIWVARRFDELEASAAENKKAQ